MKKEILYRNFMLTPSKFLPVVDQESESFIGFLSKSKIISEMSSLDENEQENNQNEISKELLEFKISDDLLSYFDIYPKIPVLNLKGEKVSFWTKTKILLEYNKIEESQKSNEPAIKDNYETESMESQKINWFLRLVLENLSDSLLVTDLKGATILYNESFEKNILKLNSFKNSIKTCESKLFQMVKNSTNSFQKINGWNIISDFEKEQKYNIHFKAISQNGQKTGYMYQFILKESISENLNQEDFQFDSNLSFSQNINSFEKLSIQKSLEENLWNISKTAKILRIPRTTLQNKIKHFQIKRA